MREGKYQTEGWRVRHGGSRFWSSVTISPLREPSGRLVGFAKVTRDVTERREQQAALEQAREALARSQKFFSRPVMRATPSFITGAWTRTSR